MLVFPNLELIYLLKFLLLIPPVLNFHFLSLLPVDGDAVDLHNDGVNIVRLEEMFTGRFGREITLSLHPVVHDEVSPDAEAVVEMIQHILDIHK